MQPDFLLFSQHGWADSSRDISSLSTTLATPQTKIIAPDLGYFQTWIRINPLIKKVEGIALETIDKYPDTPIRIIGHSMGGLIWLEVLKKHPEWWSQVESLVLIASPIGGADLARIIDPLGFGIGIARDLGINRRQIAEAIAKIIPTLIIAGNSDGGSDGTITLQSTKFLNAKFVCLPGLAHAILKNHPTVAATIRDFWEQAKEIDTGVESDDLSIQIIQRLQLVNGMTDAHERGFNRSQVHLKFKNGLTIYTWKNPFQVDHIFIANSQGECLYSGSVGWIHAKGLQKTLEDIKIEHQQHLL